MIVAVAALGVQLLAFGVRDEDRLGLWLWVLGVFLGWGFCEAATQECQAFGQDALSAFLLVFGIDVFNLLFRCVQFVKLFRMMIPYQTILLRGNEQAWCPN